MIASADWICGLVLGAYSLAWALTISLVAIQEARRVHRDFFSRRKSGKKGGA